jgi:hypothetical protein
MRLLRDLEGVFLAVFGMRGVKKRVKNGVKWDVFLGHFFIPVA